MAIHSSPSVRPQLSPGLPPSKRPRLRNNPPSLARSRRRSSPDLLDTVTASVDCDQQAGRSLISSVPLSTNSSILRQPPPAPFSGSPRHRRVLEHKYETPSAAASLNRQGGDRESPDPLDTITPVTAINSKSAATTGSETLSKPSPPPHPVAGDGELLGKRPLRNTTRTTRRSSSHLPQPAPTAAIDPPALAGRRSLRSQDIGSRSKCELANYFNNYEELLSLAPPKSESLAGDTTVNLIDDLTKSPLSSDPSPTNTESIFGNPLVKLHGCEVVELPKPKLSDTDDDPLSEETYFRPHRRLERQEKQLRNIERERCQHEKLQVDRLLDELKGYDWIRVLGITGISDAEKKLYEPKRVFFIKELSLLIEKFNLWRDEEKRRKVDAKEKPFVRADTTPLGAKSQGTESKRRTKHKKAKDESNSAFLSDSQSYGDPPDPDDMNAEAARQLRQEALSAFGKYPKPSKSNRKPTRSGRAKHASRSAEEPDQGPRWFAFGHPIPVMEEREFRLPSEILNEETIQANRRKLRRLRRERKTV